LTNHYGEKLAKILEGLFLINLAIAGGIRLRQKIDYTLRRKIGGNIRKVREMREISQTELARRLGINRDLMLKYETGDRGVSPEALAKIVNELGISIDDLFEISPEITVETQGIGVEFETWQSYALNPFEHEMRCLEYEKNCSCQRLVIPSFYAVFQTNEVVLAFWSRMHKLLYNQDFVNEDDLIRGRELRRKELYSGNRTVYQVGSEIELVRFVKGEPPYENLTSEARIDQVLHLIDILGRYPLHIDFALTKLELNTTYVIYDDTAVAMEYTYGQSYIKETQIVKGLLDDFAGLWRSAIRGVNVKNFFMKQIEEIKKLEG
jgi:transcriptional regulator with XRE-family HTH domain